MTESRTLNISFQASKGAKGGQSARMAIPITWLRQMGVTENDRQVNVSFDRNLDFTDLGGQNAKKKLV